MGAIASGVYQIVNAGGEIEAVSYSTFIEFQGAEALITRAALAEMAPASALTVGGVAWAFGVGAILFVQKYLRMGYEAAREQVQTDEYASGSAHGFVMGILNWEWPNALSHFGRFKHFKIYTMDDGLNHIHVHAYNRGLANGFHLGKAFPDGFLPCAAGDAFT